MDDVPPLVDQLRVRLETAGRSIAPEARARVVADAEARCRAVRSDAPPAGGIAEEYHEVARMLAERSMEHPEYSHLAGWVLCQGVHAAVGVTTGVTFSAATRRAIGLLNPDYYSFVARHARDLDVMVDHTRDHRFSYFSLSTLLRSYLLRLRHNGHTAILETPQYMYLRMATYLWYPNLRRIKETYDAASLGKYSHASPTMFNAGAKRPQLASCFLLHVPDSIPGLADSWKNCSIISANSGGIGLDYSSVRHSEIGQHGTSRGIVPWLKVTNEVLGAVDQGGKRKGSGTVHLADWHVDVLEFIEGRDPDGSDRMRARDLFYSLWVSDLFMTRVRNGEAWSLFCPNKARGLTEVHGEAFEELYTAYEARGLAARTVPAREVMNRLTEMQIKTGMPFVMFKDSANARSNQKNIGIIRSSNLCQEILEHTGPDEVASCNLASVSLPACVEYDVDGTASFNFDRLGRVTRALVRNLNQVIDRTYYPPEIPSVQTANCKHRPLGIGVNGLADVFMSMGVAWEEEGARVLNYQIFETMYYAAVSESCLLAKKEHPYMTFAGSPASEGKLQFDLWDAMGPAHPEYAAMARIPEREWCHLRESVRVHGLRNSLLIALMPTASSAQILGNTESFEPLTSNAFTRTVLSGQFVVLNPHLVRELERRGEWTPERRAQLLRTGGSVAAYDDWSAAAQAWWREKTKGERTTGFEDLPAALRRRFKTVYEIPGKRLLQLAADRGRFVCQSQSLNAYMLKPTPARLRGYLFYAWEAGLKTGMYYLRQMARHTPVLFGAHRGAPPAVQNKKGEEEEEEEEEGAGVCVRGASGCLACEA